MDPEERRPCGQLGPSSPYSFRRRANHGADDQTGSGKSTRCAYAGQFAAGAECRSQSRRGPQQRAPGCLPAPGPEYGEVEMKFRDFTGRYLIHCHNMNHEENFMMVRWDIVDSIAELRQKREQIAQRRREAGLPAEDGLPKSRKETA